MRPFLQLRLAYLEDLDDSAIKSHGHDFVPAADDGKEVRTMNWASDNSVSKTIKIDKTSTTFNPRNGRSSGIEYWYSPSLDLMFKEHHWMQTGMKNWDVDVVLTWLFNNWKNMNGGEEITIQRILDEA